MSTSMRKQAILAGIGTEIGGNAYTHETIEVVVTSTMCNGSLMTVTDLVGTEIAAASAATATAILDDERFPTSASDGTPEDDQELDFFDEGDTVMVRVATNNVIANYGVLNFSDAIYAGEDLTALAALGVKVQEAEAEFEYRD